MHVSTVCAQFDELFFSSMMGWLHLDLAWAGPGWDDGLIAVARSHKFKHLTRISVKCSTPPRSLECFVVDCLQTLRGQVLDLIVLPGGKLHT